MEKTLKIYNYISYKKFLLDWINSVGGRGSLTRVAVAAGCHRTYLSQALNSKVELTLDHAACLISFFHFDEIEADYFLTCVLFERATLKDAKNHFLRKLNRLNKQQQTVSARMTSATPLSADITEKSGNYYSDSIIATIHIATSCPDTQTIAQIARHYNYPQDQVEKILTYLVSMELVAKNGARYIHTGRILHLNRNSHFTRMNHLNWRLLACEDSQNSESIHYTNVFSISKKDLPVLKTRLLDFIESQNMLIHSSGTEEVLSFCCDLFAPNR